MPLLFHSHLLQRSFSFFLLSFVFVSVSANRVYPPAKVNKLVLAVSKATYLPLPTKRFIKNGRNVENPSSMFPKLLFGLIPLPPKCDPTQDKAACCVRGWTAKSYENLETEVQMFTNVKQKLVYSAFMVRNR